MNPTPSSPDSAKSPPNISAARLNANRRNARKSTGPVTEAGKARVRMNAWKHGLRAESDLIADDEADAVASRREEWADAFPVGPADGYRRWLVEQLAASSVRIDRCQDHQRHQAIYERERAASHWELDREADASKLGSRLSKDPDRVVSHLRQTAAGVDWLLARWRGLRDVLDLGQAWTDPQAQLCLDLMRTPDEFRAADLALIRGLPADELLDLVRDHLDGLDAIRDSASALDLSIRSLAEVGAPTSEGTGLARLRRYEASLWRRFHALERSYRAGRPTPAADPAELDDLDDFPALPSSCNEEEILNLLKSLDPSSSGEDPEPVPSTTALAAAPLPRPVRSPRRAPIERPTTEAPIDPPSTTNPIRLPSAPPLLQNRRARRAAAKTKQRHR